MNFIIDSPTTDVCDEGAKHAVENQKLEPFSTTLKLKYFRSPKLISSITSKICLDLRSPDMQKSMSKCARPPSLGAIQDKQSLASPQMFQSEGNMKTFSSFMKLTQTTKPSPTQCLQTREPIVLVSDTEGGGIQSPWTDSVCEHRNTVLSKPPYSKVAPKKDIPSPNIDLKIRSYIRGIHGHNTAKFLKEVHYHCKSNLERTALGGETHEQVAPTDEDPLRLFHPRIHTIVVGDTPAVSGPRVTEMPSTPSPEYCSKSKQASEHPVLSSSSALNLRKGSRDRGSQNKTSSRIAEHTQTHFDNVKSTPSNNMRLRKYIPCSPDQNPRKTNLGTELSGMTPSSSSHLFFRTRTNMGEVVLSPGNTW